MEISQEAKQVIVAFSKRPFTFRSISGLAEDSGYSKIDVLNIINELAAKGLVGQVAREKEMRFFLTIEGRKLAHELSLEAARLEVLQSSIAEKLARITKALETLQFEAANTSEAPDATKEKTNPEPEVPSK